MFELRSLKKIVKTNGKRAINHSGAEHKIVPFAKSINIHEFFLL